MTSGDPADGLKALREENQQLRRAVSELSMLNDLAREIGGSIETDAIVNTIIRKSLSALDAEQGVITLAGEESDGSMRTLIRTMDSSSQRLSLRLNEELVGWMLLHKQPLLINEPEGEAPISALQTSAGIRSLLSVPLMVRSRVIGILTMFNKKGPKGFTGEDRQLLGIIASQSAQVLENARLYEEEKELHTVRAELRLAHEIQGNLLPAAPPDLAGYDLAGASLPAQEVGGDYFDFIPVDDRRMALCVGDVSGKGLPAALLMATLQATMRGQPFHDTPVDRCMENANRLLCRSIRKGRFVTLFCGVLDAERDEMNYANAGHNRPLLFDRDGHFRRLDVAGLVLGFMPDFRYQLERVALKPGDTLLVYSDGITEAMNRQRRQYGEEKLAQLVAENSSRDAGELKNAIMKSVSEHSDGVAPNDDITLMVVRRLT